MKNSPWRDGKGDVVREIADACRRHGLRFGVYLSPWDRNHPDYGRPEYLDYYRNQLRELLTNYGPIFEVWFDGANGGDGYYGGAREKRTIDNRTYYDWENTWKIVRELQPDAVMFSDAGPDVRWVGNETGIAGDPCWATLEPRRLRAGRGRRGEAQPRRPAGHALAARRVRRVDPARLVLPRSRGRQGQDAARPARHLLQVGGAGRVAPDLNLPPDRRGQIHENDERSLRGFRQLLDATFAHRPGARRDGDAPATCGAATPASPRRTCSTASATPTGRPTTR